MSVSCVDARARLEDYAAESLGVADRRELREHLAGCSACGEEAARCDPGLLFAGLEIEEASAEDLARVLSGVRAGMALKQAERRLEEGLMRRRHGRGEGRRGRGLAAAAAALVALALAIPQVASRRPSPPAATARLGKSQTSSRAPRVPAARPAAAPVPEIPNSKFPADATIYDWNPGSGEPRVVWIVDQSLDI